jgi:hypothetical protein
MGCCRAPVVYTGNDDGGFVGSSSSSLAAALHVAISPWWARAYTNAVQLVVLHSHTGSRGGLSQEMVIICCDLFEQGPERVRQIESCARGALKLMKMAVERAS